MTLRIVPVRTGNMTGRDVLEPGQKSDSSDRPTRHNQFGHLYLDFKKILSTIIKPHVSFSTNLPLHLLVGIFDLLQIPIHQFSENGPQ
jgi:hypothetical protein